MKSKLKIWPFITAAIGIFVIAMVFYLSHFQQVSNDPEKWAFFGDYLGGVLGPALTFISLIGVIYTLETTAGIDNSTTGVVKTSKESA